jgi:hypothetical protein
MARWRPSARPASRCWSPATPARVSLSLSFPLSRSLTRADAAISTADNAVSVGGGHGCVAKLTRDAHRQPRARSAQSQRYPLHFFDVARQVAREIEWVLLLRALAHCGGRAGVPHAAHRVPRAPAEDMDRSASPPSPGTHVVGKNYVITMEEHKDAARLARATSAFQRGSCAYVTDVLAVCAAPTRRRGRSRRSTATTPAC